ncbi:hypothetical protein [Pseudalkalibacillus salsuginis]|uniref:hypothetical protein n=1 Tax=Pseudalkalibacillus salsuginis TaxID=2910972 RepID=UPI001F3A80E0|nr:hypothetical protein [Pseudalkalibacillus salsuginis]MCF6408226.1 hypothetical protein [Pseudalkalibacillus salsuginis]
MEYILENVWTTDKVPRQKHVHIRNNVICYVSERPLKMKCYTVNSTGLNVVPGHILRNFSLSGMDEESLLNHCEELVSRGCTTVVSAFPLKYTKEFEHRLESLRKQLSNLPIDYVIGVQLPMTRISPSLIRNCQRHKLPFINTIVEQEEDLDTVIWEWIRNVNFPYTIPILADWSQLPVHEKRLLQLKEKWKRLCKEKSIATIDAFPEEGERLSKDQLQGLGIYPKKGSWISGSDVDYLIYEGNISVDGEEILKYDGDNNPAIVVQNGTVIKVGEEFRLEPGTGRELKIIRPGIFRAMSNDLL